MLAGYQVKAIVAMAENRVIGINNQLPWHLPEDLKRFSKLTTGHAVLMGRKTYDSLPDKFRPLPNRLNLVLTTNAELKSNNPNVVFISNVPTLERQLQSQQLKLPSDQIWVIGGAAIYELTFSLWDELHLTRVAGEYEGDVVLPPFEDSFKLVEEEGFSQGAWERYLR